MSDLNKIELFKQSLEKHMNALHSASQSYDKAILSLSTAALGFTFAFTELSSATNYCYILGFTWFFLIISILFILISFLIDQLHCAHKIKYCYWRILKEGNEVKYTHCTDCWMIPIPILAGVCFIIGITLFTIFVAINIS